MSPVNQYSMPQSRAASSIGLMIRSRTSSSDSELNTNAAFGHSYHHSGISFISTRFSPTRAFRPARSFPAYFLKTSRSLYLPSTMDSIVTLQADGFVSRNTNMRYAKNPSNAMTRDASACATRGQNLAYSTKI